jgi:S-ribosylhomocysteine lyase
MEKIKSFTVDHLTLEPGIYESRRDKVSDTVIITYDLRVTKPNAEPVMNTAEIHTIEHLGATYLRNHPLYNEKIIYFGPMGCRTGFYLLINGELPHDELFDLIEGMYEFIADYEGEIPGANEKDCGNGLDHNLTMAKWVARKALARLSQIKDQAFEY